MRERGGRRVERSGEVNLVPILNLVTMLIPFLLLFAQFVSLAVVDASLPDASAPVRSPASEENARVQLTVLVGDLGYTVRGADAVLGSMGPGLIIPCRGGICVDAASYDVRELRRVLGRVKDEIPEQEEIVIVPGSTVSYEAFIAALDATREDPEVLEEGRPRLLFPAAIIAGEAG